MVDESNQQAPSKQSTAHVIEVARRPLIVAQHKAIVEEALGQIGDPLLAQLDEIPPLISNIGDDHSLHSPNFGDGLTEHACLAGENRDFSEATLVESLGQCYRHVQNHLKAHQGDRSSPLEGLNTRKCGDLSAIHGDSRHVNFGSIDDANVLTFTQHHSERCRDSLRLISRASDADIHWDDAGGEPPLGREEEEPTESLPPEQRRSARQQLIQRRIRNSFFKNVFLVYFDRDTLDPAEIEAHPTILDWLNAIAETPHLFPFMQGQTQGQKLFRLRELWRKILQLNELYQRVDKARSNIAWTAMLSDKTTEECMQLLAHDRYPAIKVNNDFSVATALCPFATFAKWVQDKVGDKDFVLPPDPKSAKTPVA